MKKQILSSIITIAIFGAASVALGLLKIPSPVGSIALDSLPGYFAAGYFNPLIGGIIGLIGHLGSAATAGFPLGAMHIVVAVQMFLWCGIFGYLIRKINNLSALFIASGVAIILNGVVSPFTLVPFGLPLATAKGLVVYLVIASTLNVLVAALAIKFLATSRIRGI